MNIIPEIKKVSGIFLCHKIKVSAKSGKNAQVRGYKKTVRAEKNKKTKRT